MSKDKNNNLDRITELKLKIIEIKLERDKYLHKSLFSLVIAIITFAVTSGILANTFNENVKSAIIASFNFSIYLGLAVSVLIAIGLPIIAYLLSHQLLSFFLKTTQKVYDTRISEIEKMIKELT